MSEIKLLPCPFCGGEEIEETYYSFMPVLKCKICGAIMTFPASFRGNYRTELARKWNTRKPMQEIVERLEEDSKHWNKKKKEALKNRELEEANRYDAFEIADNHLINFVKEVGGMNG